MSYSLPMKMICKGEGIINCDFFLESKVTI